MWYQRWRWYHLDQGLHWCGNDVVDICEAYKHDDDGDNDGNDDDGNDAPYNRFFVKKEEKKQVCLSVFVFFLQYSNNSHVLWDSTAF